MFPVVKYTTLDSIEDKMKLSLVQDLRNKLVHLSTLLSIVTVVLVLHQQQLLYLVRDILEILPEVTVMEQLFFTNVEKIAELDLVQIEFSLPV